MSLLRFSPCSGRLELDLLALAGVSHAVPLLDPLDTVSSGRPLRSVPPWHMTIADSRKPASYLQACFSRAMELILQLAELRLLNQISISCDA